MHIISIIFYIGLYQSTQRITGHPQIRQHMATVAHLKTCISMEHQYEDMIFCFNHHSLWSSGRKDIDILMLR